MLSRIRAMFLIAILPLAASIHGVNDAEASPGLTTNNVTTPRARVAAAGRAATPSRAARRASVRRRPESPSTDPGSRLPDPVNMGSYGTYSLRFSLWRAKTAGHRANFLDWTPAQMMSQLNSSFSHYFTFTGCGKQLRVNATCNLKGPLGTSSPVKVIAIAPHGFALKSLPGHPEGGGRTIRFQFQRYTNAAEISTMSLAVDAWGPLGGISLSGPLGAKAAEGFWNTFQNNIRERFPRTPPGGSSTNI
jgi:hypothetical protein